MAATRPPNSEITNPLAEELLLLLLGVRRDLVNALNTTDDEQNAAFRSALVGVESLEELIRPDLFSSAALDD